MSYTLLVVRCFVQTGQNAPHEAFLVVVLDINYTLPFLQMFRGGDEGATVERAVFGYYKYELGHSLDYESGTSCIKIFHLGIERGQNTVDVDVYGVVNQLRQGVEMAYDVVDVCVHFSRKDGTATYVHLYGSVHIHRNI